MKTTLLTVTLCLLLFAKDSQQAGPIPLSMMDKSVDDMYDGCMKNMKKFESRYLKCDMKNDDFKTAWEAAKKCTKQKKKIGKTNKLSEDHVRALCVYTGLKIYEKFNAAVRSGRDSYTSKAFKYYALHFLLTSAIQILKAGKEDCCILTYRRNSVSFTGKEAKEIRFGSFASTSVNSNKTVFGHATCFRIWTCLGAPIQDFSALSTEKEVLIPPYEKFRITKIEKGSSTTVEGLKDCDTIFHLESTGKLSNLNCKAPKPPVRKKGLDIFSEKIKSKVSQKS